MMEENDIIKDSRHKPAEIVRVDIHSWAGQLIDRMKAKTTEKNKGALIINRLKDVFGISEKDIREAIQKENEISINDSLEIIPKDIRDSKYPTVWKRDSRGHII